MIAALLLQSSALLAGPLHLEPEPPELRALQYMVFPHEGVPGLPPGLELSKEDALAAAGQVLAAIRGPEGASFPDLAKRLMRGRSIELGAYAEGMLPAPLDEFLFAAEMWEVSEPLETAAGVQLVRRVPAWAGARTILLAGEDAAERADAVRRRLQAGEPFADVARDASDDREAAARGGATQIYQRGPNDALVKAACFGMEPGVWRGPLESPLGLHFVQRVEPAELEGLAEYERTCVRLRALLVPWGGSLGEASGVPAAAPDGRTREAALELALAYAAELADGETTLAELAARANEDPGGPDDPLGRERAGDLGWVFRGDPRLAPWTATLFSRPVGWTAPAPLVTPVGYALVERVE